MAVAKKIPQLLIWGVYGLVALSVLAPLLGRGFVLTLDMVFTPHIRMPAMISSSYFFRALLHALNYILPGDVVQKLLLFAIFVLAGVGAHKLAERTAYSVQRTENSTQRTAHSVQRAESLPRLNAKRYTLNAIPFFFSGIFYMINPFTYDRLMAGQYNVLFGYALLPWFAMALLMFMRAPDWRRTLELTAWAVAISIVSIHSIGFMALLGAAAFGVFAWKKRMERAWLRRIFKFGALSLIFFAIASCYWLVPLAIGHGSTAAQISDFGAPDRAAFATLGGNWIGRFGNVLLLQGFWAEDTDMFTMPQDSVPGWFLIGAFVWFLVILGAVGLWKARRRTELAIFGSVGLVAGILAAGTLNGWLASHVPLFAGYREPQKFTALVALCFAIFAGQGVATIVQVTHLRRGYGGQAGYRLGITRRTTLATCYLLLSTLLLLAIPFIWTSVMLQGASHQLAPAQYPAAWFAANKLLDADAGKFKVLFLPWHEYMSFDFEGRIIANPAPQFFDKPVIISNNPEFGDISPGKNITASAIGGIVSSANSRSDLAARLAPYNIKYIILARDDDYTNYNYLHRQPGLVLVSKSATLELYRNKFAGE